jgi:hypothetical protein
MGMTSLPLYSGLASSAMVLGHGQLCFSDSTVFTQKAVSQALMPPVRREWPDRELAATLSDSSGRSPRACRSGRIPGDWWPPYPDHVRLRDCPSRPEAGVTIRWSRAPPDRDFRMLLLKAPGTPDIHHPQGRIDQESPAFADSEQPTQGNDKPPRHNGASVSEHVHPTPLLAFYEK